MGSLEDKAPFCHCDSGWQGPSCDQDLDECLQENNPCQNGGECLNSEGGFQCRCPRGFTGRTCETGIEECKVLIEMATSMWLRGSTTFWYN